MKSIKIANLISILSLIIYFSLKEFKFLKFELVKFTNNKVLFIIYILLLVIPFMCSFIVLIKTFLSLKKVNILSLILFIISCIGLFYWVM